ncbi:hypothetical protein D3C87_2121590 [compost metagenome]
MTIALSAARLLPSCLAIALRRLFFSIELVFAMSLPSLFRYCRKGKLKALSSARASSSVRAVVHTMMSMPQV